MAVTPSNHPNNSGKAHRVVENRRSTILEAFENDNEFIKELTQNYDRDVKRDLDTPAQVIPELLQNADDVEQCSAVTVKINDKELVVRNNGRPLLENEFEALTHIGESTKKEPGYIGHFGRGFKSVFSVTDNPQVRSGFFRFQFDRDRCILPEHLELDQNGDQEPYIEGTEVQLPLKKLSEHERSQLEGHVESLHRLMPYLRHVSEVVVIDHGERTTYSREKTVTGSLTEVTIYKNGGVHERRHIFGTEQVLPEAQFVELVQHRDLRNEDKFRDEPVPIKISFPVDEDGGPISTDEPSRFFNFFPTQEELEIPFDIQADFLLDSDRKRLHDTESPYNEWILGQVSRVFEKAVGYYLSQHPSATHFLEVIPTRKNLDPYLKRVQQDILEVLEEWKCIPGFDEQWYYPHQIRVPEAELIEILSETDAQRIFGEQIHYPSKSLTQRLLNNLVKIELVESISIEDVFYSEGGTDVYRAKSPAELLRLAALYNELWEDSYRGLPSYKSIRKDFITAAKQIPLVPLRDGRVVKAATKKQSPEIPPTEDEEQYDLFIDRLNLVNLRPDVTIEDDEEREAAWAETVESARSFYSEVLDLSTVEDGYIISDVIASAFEDVAEETDETLDNFLEFILAESSRKRTALQGDWLRLRERSAEGGESVYRKPSELYLSDEYDVGYSLETILQSVDSALFVTPDYLNLNGGTAQWKSFLSRAGVKDKLEVTEDIPDDRTRFRERKKLKAELEKGGDTKTDIPEASKKAGHTYDTWLNYYRYALSDHKPSKPFRTVLDSFSDQGQSGLSVAHELAEMVHQRWDEYTNHLNYTLYYANQRGKGNAYHADPMETSLQSTFGTVIQETAWIPTKAETLQPPSTLFIDSSRTQGQDEERYVNEGLPFSDEVYEKLGVSGRLGPEAIVKLLSQASTVWNDKDPNSIRAVVTTQLTEFQAGLITCSEAETERLLNSLQEARFIYVESAEPQFRSPQQVVLKGTRLGDELVVISELYEQHHSFFHDRLGVQERVSIDDCLDYLGATTDEEPTEEQFKTWRVVVRRLLGEHGGLSDEEFLDLPVVARLEQEDVLPTCAESFGSLSDIRYYCDSEELISKVSDESTRSRILRRPESKNISSQRLASMWDLLDLEDLETVVDLELTEKADQQITDEIARLTDDGRLDKLLTVCWSFLDEVDVSDDSTAQLVAIRTYTVEEHEKLQGKYSVNGNEISDTFPLESFFDHEHERLLRTTTVESYYDIAAKLVGTLQLTRPQEDQLASLLSGAVGTEEDFLKPYLADHGVELKQLPEEKSEKGDQDTEDQTQPQSEEVSQSESESEQLDTPSDESEDAPESSTTEPDSAQGPGTKTTAQETASGTGTVAGTNLGGGEEPSSPTAGSTRNPPSSVDIPSNTSTGATNSGTPDSNSSTSESTTPEPSVSDSTSKFDPDVLPTDIDSKAVLSNRPEKPRNARKTDTPVIVAGGGGGGGGGGGRSANKVGRYGEEFVLKELVETIRRAVPSDSPTVSWHWTPKHMDLSAREIEGDQVEVGSRLKLDDYSVKVPGVEIKTDELTVQILHIREEPLGADILIRGVACTAGGDGADILEPVEFSPEVETWIEVKSSQSTPTAFELTPYEYGRAREQRDEYHILTLCNVGTDEMYVDEPLTDLGDLISSDVVKIKGDNLRVYY